MNFSSALFSMLGGHRVSRGHWEGYWCIENGEIIMHLRDGRILNIRESEDMIYTIGNMLCDDWRIVDNFGVANELKPPMIEPYRK